MTLRQDLQEFFLRIPRRTVPEWVQLAPQIGFDYVPRHRVARGDGLRTDQLHGRADTWPLKMDIWPLVGQGVDHQTRFIVACAADSALRFAIRSSDAGDAIAAVFGRGKDIQVGDATFDFSFVVRGSNEEAIRLFLADADLRRAFPRVAPFFRVELADAPGGEGELPNAALICWVGDLLTTAKEVRPWLALVKRVLDRLAEVRLIARP